MITQRPAIAAGLALWVLVAVTGCANSPTGKTLEESFAADQRLQQSNGQSRSPSGDLANRPADFPAEIPIYANAQLQAAPSATPSDAPGPTPNSAENAQGGQARWSSPDPSSAVRDFYQTELQTNGWQIVSQGIEPQTFVARRGNLQATVSIRPFAAVTASPTPNSNVSTPAPTASPTPTANTATPQTEFTIQYVYDAGTAPSSDTTSSSPQPGDTNFVGPVSSNATPAAETDNAIATNATEFSDIDKAPKELQQYIRDLARLGVLSLPSTNAKANTASSTQFEPNKTITRREYARWLVTANNRIHANRPGQQVRLASSNAKPTFQDVPTSHPDFAIIQGLAEAGIIPSALSGDTTVTTFKPDAPLTRETLLLWKVPLDTRQALPSATLDAVKQTWGFQDAAKIEPKALRAVLADFQNSDLANIRRAFGYTTLFQPKKPVTRAEAAATIWYFGAQGDGQSALEVLQTQRNEASPSPIGP